MITSTDTVAATGVDRRAERARELAWTGFRIVIGFLFACHGAQIMFGAFGGVDGAGTPSPLLSFDWWPGVICLVGGTLVLVGLWTRSAAVICSGSMAFAYFSVHQPLGPLPLVNQGELSALYAWAFLVIATAGPGRYAIDALVRRARTR